MKILFVDDEKIIRDGIRAIINWEKIGCQKLVMAENAARALELLENEAFDLVITDIYMQKMNGIELAKKIYDTWPWMRVIILSAYEDFTYAREAIEAGVFKYLLKPIVPAELENTVLEAFRQVEESRQIKQQVRESEEFIHVFRPQLAADFWRALLKGEVSDKQDAKRRMELAGIVFPDRGLWCVAAVWKGKENLNGKDLKNSIEEAAKGAFSGCMYWVRMGEKRVVLLLSHEPDSSQLLLFSYLFGSEIHQEVQAAAGRLARDWMEISLSFKDAEVVLKAGGRLGQEGENLVFQSIKLIEEHLSQEDFGVNDIAQRLHVSAGYFSRLFKKQMGITCIEYLTQKRIERARKLLERTEMKHQAIAQAVGYASVYYFSLQFKKQTGETPGQYRKRVGKKDDSDD